MFERTHHRAVAEVLDSLDAGILAQGCCYFGGGTAIALRYGEIRVSTDVDFLVSDRNGYRVIRERVTEHGLESLFGTPVPIIRGPLTDQYGIRSLIGTGTPIKFEIVREGRIEFDHPGTGDEVCGIASLTTHDLVASKILANDDRWADRSLFSRDIIDLAIMQPDAGTWERGMLKARAAYGDTTATKVIRAVDNALDRQAWLDQCRSALQIDGMTVDQLRDRLGYIRDLVA
ncbi:nucleotidyl transferase AbiEii/AbiGii toxin family protein [Gordonia sp. TBRC 11910]|uniref:Nucleotidyl transferase AbiEii/AbiGii toxin family protein n=1 Tax=Gordonia asplenii TaxID=2725283 RepID=A0A848KUH9_9ACTN|nr:nucleotidyl transferase AbiEii/AbiGii toxin family protein [Gordonia asplenii]